MQSDDSNRPLGEQFQALQRRSIYPAIVIPAIMLLAVYLAFALTPRYRATGTIMLEQTTIPDDLIRTTVASYADQQIEIVRRRVLTNSTLQRLVREQDPYPERADLSDSEKAELISDNTEIERVDPVTLKTLDESTAFSIHYHNPDPRLARDIADRLVDMFLTYNQRTRAERASETFEFLNVRSRELGESIRELEQRLAKFKTEYGDALPEAQGRNLASLDQTQRDLEGTMGQLRMVQEQESILRLQLREISPSIAAPVGDWRMELAKLKGELAAAEQRYTEDHPDVRRLRRAIADLAAAGQSSESAVVGTPDNPDYLRVKSQLDATQREIAALSASAGRARAQIARYSGQLRMAPNVERQYAQLSREYEISQDQFRDIQEKLRDASLARTLESQQRGERFTLIRSPSIPGSPYSPNRLGIILLGFVLAIGLSAGLVAFVESADPTVRGSRDIRALTSLPLISAVPIMRTTRDQRTRTMAWTSASIAVLVAAALVAYTVITAVGS